MKTKLMKLADVLAEYRNHSEYVHARAALEAEIDRVCKDTERSKLTKIERECLLIGKEIQRAAGELPEGYEIEICVERGYGGVALRKPDDATVDFDNTVDGLSHCITQAIDTAMQGETT